MAVAVPNFQVLARDGAARRGRLSTPHGVVETPAFMTVGTLAAVKGLTPAQLRAHGAQIVLSNTYHLAVRPGETVVRDFGGLAAFMGWHGPTLTDSGGYQVFSLASRRALSEEGVRFRNHVDGRELFLSPERALEIQRALGPDLMMVLDVCPPGNAARDEIRRALELTHAWARRARTAYEDGPGRGGQWLLGIVQGGVHEDLRAESAQRLVELDFPAYAIGGVAVGEPAEEIERVARFTAARLPDDRLRYLMGVGRPQDLLNAIDGGVDIFDCVMPTRHARHAQAFTRDGTINLKNAAFRDDHGPLDPECDCEACRTVSRGYIRHLAMAREIMAVVYLTLHNVRFYLHLLEDVRAAIAGGRYADFRRERLRRLDA